MAKKTFSSVTSNIFNKGAQQNQSLETQIKANIKILPELKNLIRPLSNDELQQLEDNIIAEGCRDALVIWKKEDEYILIDGHNRFGICQKHNIDYKIAIKHFENIDEVKDWMLDNQLGKRNLSENEISYLRGIRYKNFKQKHGGDRKNLVNESSGQNDYLKKTSEKVAEQFKVSAKTIQRDEKYAEAIDKISDKDEDLKWKILSRQIDIPKNKIEQIAELPQNQLQVLTKELKKGLEIKQVLESFKEKPQQKKNSVDTKSEIPFEDFDKVAKKLLTQFDVKIEELIKRLKDLK